jgi:hypothetical protein
VQVASCRRACHKLMSLATSSHNNSDGRALDRGQLARSPYVTRACCVSNGSIRYVFYSPCHLPSCSTWRCEVALDGNGRLLRLHGTGILTHHTVLPTAPVQGPLREHVDSVDVGRRALGGSGM